MDRKELLDVLNDVSPALSGKDFVPVFSCFCFDGDNVTAFDDVVALQRPFLFPLQGAIRGSVLLSFLKVSRAKDIEFEQHDTSVHVKAGRSKLDLPFIPKDKFVFEFPKEDATAFDLNADFLLAFDKTMVSMGLDPARPWRLGITLSFKENYVSMYSSDNITIALGDVPFSYPKELEGTAVVVPPRFCKLLSDYSNTATAVKMKVTAGWVECIFDGSIRLFSKTVGGVDVAQFEKMVKVCMEGSAKDGAPIPKGFESTLDKAAILLEDSQEKFADFSVQDGRLSVHAKTKLGELEDILTLEHPNVKVKVAPALIKRTLKFAQGIAISPQCLTIFSENFLNFISVASV